MKAWLFRQAMASERKRAGLKAQLRRLSFGPIAYLDNGAAAEAVAGEHKPREVLLLRHGACCCPICRATARVPRHWSP